MILIIPPGFILGGALMASAVLPDWVNTFKFAFPLTWQFEFWRDNAYRGIEFSTMLGTYGKYILYLSVLVGILYIIHNFSREKMNESIQQTNHSEQNETML